MPPDNPPRKWRGVGRTDRGLIRRSNQDAFAIMNDLRVWVVADGMGGHAGGDVASQLAVETVIRHIQTAVAHDAPVDDQTLLRSAIKAAQQTVLDRARVQPELTGMGTTLVVLRISPGDPPRATLAHVGDSRAYRLRAGQLTILTRDHSLVEDYIRRGLITEAQGETHPLRHVLTRAIGLEAGGDPDVSNFGVGPNDLFLLCTDGLTKMVDDQHILTTLVATGASPEDACQALIEDAIQAGGEDNVTVVICPPPD